MRFPRRSGILLHPTSLPGQFGIGDLGHAAYRFVDFLAASGQSYWQVLPLSPTGSLPDPLCLCWQPDAHQSPKAGGGRSPVRIGPG
jgi:4-alpha-glucanotransferase